MSTPSPISKDGSARQTIQGCCSARRVFEVVDDDAVDLEMDVLDHSVVIGGHKAVSERSTSCPQLLHQEKPKSPTTEPTGLGVPNRVQDIRRVAACRDGDDDVACPYEILQLLDKDRLVTQVVGEGRQDRRVVVQAEDSKTAHVGADRVLREIGRHVACGRSATTVSERKYLLAVPIRSVEHLGELGEAMLRQAVDRSTDGSEVVRGGVHLPQPPVIVEECDMGSAAREPERNFPKLAQGCPHVLLALRRCDDEEEAAGAGA